MMRAILRKAKETRRGLAFDFMSDVPYAIRKADDIVEQTASHCLGKVLR